MQRGNIYTWIENNPIKTLVFVGIFIRLLVAVLYQHITLYPDSEGYVQLAERMLKLDLSGYEGERSPGYPLLLAMTSVSYLFTAILQSVIGIFSSVITYKLCILLGLGKRLSLITTLCIVCYLPVVFFELAILTEALTLFVILSISYLYFSILKGKTDKKINVLLILTCGFLVLVKPFYIFLPVLLFGFLFFTHISAKKILSRYIYLLLVPLVLFLGWSYVNKLNTGYFTSTTFYGYNLAQNCVSFAEKTTPEYQEIGNIYATYRDNRSTDKEIAMTIWEAYPELKEKTGLSFPDLSNELYKYSITTIKENPVDYMKQVFVSWRDFWKTSLYWEYDSVAVPYANDILLYICYAERILLQLIKILFVLLIPFHIIGSIRKRELSYQFIIAVIIFTASVLQALITYGTNSRFSFPFEILMVISVILTLRGSLYKRMLYIDYLHR